MSATQTVTVLYYNPEELLTICKEILFDLPTNEAGRVLLPVDFRENKVIVAVLEGEVKVLNCLGDRDYGEE